MIIIGIVLLLIAWLAPELVPGIPYGILHVCSILGGLALLIGVILLILSLAGRPVGRGFGGRPGRWY